MPLLGFSCVKNEFQKLEQAMFRPFLVFVNKTSKVPFENQFKYKLKKQFKNLFKIKYFLVFKNSLKIYSNVNLRLLNQFWFEICFWKSDLKSCFMKKNLFLFPFLSLSFWPCTSFRPTPVAAAVHPAHSCASGPTGLLPEPPRAPSVFGLSPTQQQQWQPSQPS